MGDHTYVRMHAGNDERQEMDERANGASRSRSMTPTLQMSPDCDPR